MISRITRLLITVSLALAFAASAFAASPSSRYLIKLKNSAERFQAEELIQSSGFEIQRFIPEISVYVADGRPSRQDLRNLARSPRIGYVERNAIWRAVNVPNDTKYSEQDGLKRMEPEAAWDVTTGSSAVVVAVSDSGITLDHPDLKNELWTNPAGGPDLHGYNFVNNTPDPTDDHKHGTHVSGIIGAEGGNSAGVAGVNWHVQIMATKFLDKDGSGTTDHAIDAILYAAKHGARLMNASWGGASFSQAQQDAINYGFEHGMLFIAAAGNDSKNTDETVTYPAGYAVPGVLSIASSQGAGSLSSFSNYGARTVDLAAPGSNIMSTLPAGQYGRLSGTSMATPMATGVAALMLSVRPELTPLELRNALLNAVEERTGYAGKLSTAGDLNARLAIQQLSQGFQVWPSRITAGVGDTFSFSAYQANGTVSWSSQSPEIATVDSQGNLKALKAGSTQISAQDASGATVTTQWVKVVAAGASNPGGPGGCGGARGPNPDELPMSDASAALSLGLPLAVGALIRKRRTATQTRD
jgi:subtilisin family serine protease